MAEKLKKFFNNGYVSAFLIILVLYSFAYFFYQPFIAKKIFVYEKSDFQQTSTKFDHILSEINNLSDNSDYVQYGIVATDLKSLNDLARDNSAYLNSNVKTNAGLYSDLVGLYSLIDEFSLPLIPQYEGLYTSSSLSPLIQTINFQTATTDNFNNLSNAVLAQSIQADKVKLILLENQTLNHDSKYQQFVQQYFTLFKSYCADLSTLLSQTADVINLQNRDRTRELISEFEATTTKYKDRTDNLQINFYTTPASADEYSLISKIQNKLDSIGGQFAD